MMILLLNSQKLTEKSSAGRANTAVIAMCLLLVRHPSAIAASWELLSFEFAVYLTVSTTDK